MKNGAKKGNKSYNNQLKINKKKSNMGNIRVKTKEQLSEHLESNLEKMEIAENIHDTINDFFTNSKVFDGKVQFNEELLGQGLQEEFKKLEDGEFYHVKFTDLNTLKQFAVYYSNIQGFSMTIEKKDRTRGGKLSVDGVKHIKMELQRMKKRIEYCVSAIQYVKEHLDELYQTYKDYAELKEQTDEAEDRMIAAFAEGNCNIYRLWLTSKDGTE